MANPCPRKVIVADYDPSWPTIFEALRSRIVLALQDLAVSIEHVGSTAVPGLAAKPVIDMDIVIRTRAELPAVIEGLAAIGYVHSGNLGIEGREAFGSPPSLPAHHLYVCVQGGSALMNHLTVRDHLRRDAAAAAAYGRLKMQLAARFPHDREGYVAAKTDFLAALLRTAGIADATGH